MTGPPHADGHELLEPQFEKEWTNIDWDEDSQQSVTPEEGVLVGAEESGGKIEAKPEEHAVELDADMMEKSFEQAFKSCIAPIDRDTLDVKRPYALEVKLNEIKGRLRIIVGSTSKSLLVGICLLPVLAMFLGFMLAPRKVPPTPTETGIASKILQIEPTVLPLAIAPATVMTTAISVRAKPDVAVTFPFRYNLRRIASVRLNKTAPLTAASVPTSSAIASPFRGGDGMHQFPLIIINECGQALSEVVTFLHPLYVHIRKWLEKLELKGKLDKVRVRLRKGARAIATTFEGAAVLLHQSTKKAMGLWADRAKCAWSRAF